MPEPDYWLNAAWELMLTELKNWIDDLFHFRWDAASYHWFMVGVYITSLAEIIVNRIEEEATKVTTAIETWATGIIGYVETGAATIVDRIASIWDSITGVWATFGANLLDENLTVEDWVERAFDKSWKWVSQHWIDAVADIDFFYNWVIDWGNAAAVWVNDHATDITDWFDEKATNITDWIEDNSAPVWNWIRDNSATVWNWIRDNSATVWDWIRDHASDFSDWLTGKGTPMETLYDKVSVWLEDLYDRHKDLLATFLDDPGKFIGDYLTEWFEGTEDKPGPDWFAFLKKLFNDPIGTLLAEFEKWHTLIANWITKWLDENFEPIEQAIAKIVPPDRGMPDVMAWAKGLREPETDEEKAYVAYLDEKLQHILDDIILDKPIEIEV